MVSEPKQNVFYIMKFKIYRTTSNECIFAMSDRIKQNNNYYTSQRAYRIETPLPFNSQIFLEIHYDKVINFSNGFTVMTGITQYTSVSPSLLCT